MSHELVVLLSDDTVALVRVDNGIGLAMSWLRDDWGGDVAKIDWGSEGSLPRVELDTLMSAIPAEDRRVAKAKIRAALQLCLEPLGHPDADNRPPLIAIPGLLIPGRGAERWITVVVGLMDVSVIVLRVCEGSRQASETGFPVVVDDAEWVLAEARWEQGSW